jgi:RHH-type proline utilization regulon transcriptional repressor/proline dehydrogenase/delta 1-pyrroline-5-carboxylate dehydrogenase
VGNTYVNRNQIGAVVGSQPFGGHGLSGTGPKAGGPRYVARLQRDVTLAQPTEAVSLPGPTGETNRYSVEARGRIGCFGPGVEALAQQMAIVRDAGAEPIEATDAPPEALRSLGLEGAVYWGPDGRALAQALAALDGPIVPLWTDKTFANWLVREKVVSVDTTAAGGNTALLAAMDTPAEPAL